MRFGVNVLCGVLLSSIAVLTNSYPLDENVDSRIQSLLDALVQRKNTREQVAKEVLAKVAGRTEGKREKDIFQNETVDPDSENMPLLSSFQVIKHNIKYKANNLHPENSKTFLARQAEILRMTHDQKVERGLETEESGDERDISKKSLTTLNQLWPKKIVPYKIEDTLVLPEGKDLLDKGIKMFNRLTCVQWLLHTKSLEDFVGHKTYVAVMSDNEWCWASDLGKTGKDKQDLSMSGECLEFSTILHEMFHVMGAEHEQCRSDRDYHVKVQAGADKANFGKWPTRNSNPYDYESIMHYPESGPLTVLNEELAFLTHSNDKLSFYDIADITDTYKCAEECVNPPECINGGFVYSECECYCPYGLTGPFCEQVTSDDCGGIIDLTPGNDYTITSPNFPNNYDAGKECVWLLRAPEDYRVRVDVDFLHLPYNDDLKRCYHWLQVRYNLVGQTGIRKCGDSTGDTWVTTPWGEKNLMLLIFDSKVGQGHSPEKGFSLRARTVKDGCSVDPCIYGMCEDCDDGSFKCKCFPGFEGQHCEFVDASTPLECTFEKHYRCFMKNVDNDDFDWSEKVGPTVTKLTGPDKAISGDLYLYAESSIPRKPGDKAIFESDVTFPAEDRCLEFYFNMFGSGMGTLTVKSSEAVLWTKTGNQGFGWHKASIHIPSTDNLKLRIEATRGSDYESDIAIDDVKLSPGTCETPRKSDCLSSPKGTDYRGIVSVTTNGRTCQRWDSNSPWSHDYHVYDEYDNYCRNDLHDSEAPWCYTTDAQVRWELCDIPHCHIEECVRSMNGYDYLGTKDTTIRGQTCEPNKDGVRACRGSFDYDSPWCFIDQNENWDSCDIPKCTTPPAECLQTPKGIDYFGSTAVTETGRTCQRWDKQEPHQHKFWALVDQDNYCRNPDGDNRPWCFTTDPDMEFEYCKISYCDELACSSNPCEHGGTCTDTENGGFNCQCRSGYIGTKCESRSADDDCKRSKIGYEYNGKIHETKNKVTCQEWAKDDPHSHRFNNLPENYCRNPDQDVEPWCFTTDPNTVFDFCDIPFCTTPAKECLGTDNGILYFGTMKQTKDGIECQSWSAQTPHSHKYGYLEDQGNYCRNPDQDENGPWCFTTDPDIQWQSCDIPHC
ncbi:uncharacterized protein LOC143071810 isoform X1 [Mytilus galloprovincialis]|uniref:uncharacterized protein LOC143071810 isoform X1 n=2 Tax=Mytilus galloprovincialis TaxID=29158 RepID=UPI003F7CBB23